MEVNVITNEERAERGWAILEMYAMSYGDPNDHTANLTDVLADLMHLSKWQSERKLHFDRSLEIARGHFEAELEEEQLT